MKRPKLDGFTEIIDCWLEKDRRSRHKQRHTANRIRVKHGFTGD